MTSVIKKEVMRRCDDVAARESCMSCAGIDRRVAPQSHRQVAPRDSRTPLYNKSYPGKVDDTSKTHNQRTNLYKDGGHRGQDDAGQGSDRRYDSGRRRSPHNRPSYHHERGHSGRHRDDSRSPDGSRACNRTSKRDRGESGRTPPQSAPRGSSPDRPPRSTTLGAHASHCIDGKKCGLNDLTIEYLHS